jgi:hypothetical protein
LLRPLHLLALHVEIPLYPFHLAERADAVVEHGAADIADAGRDEQLPWIEACQHERRQHHFAAEREHTARHERGNQHSPVAPRFEYGEYSGH